MNKKRVDKQRKIKISAIKQRRETEMENLYEED